VLKRTKNCVVFETHIDLWLHYRLQGGSEVYDVILGKSSAA